MNDLSAVFSALAAGIILQNVVLARAFFSEDPNRFSRTYRGTLRLGLITAAVAVLATVFAVALRQLFAQALLWAPARWAAYFCCVAVSFLLLRPLFARLLNGRHGVSDKGLLYAAFNGAVYGIVLLSMANYTSPLLAIVYALGCSIGLTAAQLLIHAGSERISLSAVPRPFAGLPILLIYIGILSLAIYGLVGHQLPT